jgi:hypothetical protein
MPYTAHRESNAAPSLAWISDGAWTGTVQRFTSAGR